MNTPALLEIAPANCSENVIELVSLFLFFFFADFKLTGAEGIPRAAISCSDNDFFLRRFLEGLSSAETLCGLCGKAVAPDVSEGAGHFVKGSFVCFVSIEGMEEAATEIDISSVEASFLLFPVLSSMRFFLLFKGRGSPANSGLEIFEKETAFMDVDRGGTEDTGVGRAGEEWFFPRKLCF
jgi:hypothetical protein